jgi:hypothetical protein
MAGDAAIHMNPLSESIIIVIVIRAEAPGLRVHRYSSGLAVLHARYLQIPAIWQHYRHDQRGRTSLFVPEIDRLFVAARAMPERPASI